MSEEQLRYLFTVRQRFGEEPVVDCFYKLTMPNGVSGAEARIMVGLKDDWYEDEIRNDTQAINGMNMRLRFNSDMFPNICMVSTGGELDAEMMDHVVLAKHKTGELIKWLKEASI